MNILFKPETIAVLGIIITIQSLFVFGLLIIYFLLVLILLVQKYYKKYKI
jgi:hypothetical protein